MKKKLMKIDDTSILKKLIDRIKRAPLGGIDDEEPVERVRDCEIEREAVVL